MATEEQRLARIEAELAAIRAMLGERCATRGASLDDHELRISALEDAEQQRRGGKVMLAGLMAAAGAAGGVAAKIFALLGAR